jgi:hypothetical protein
MDSHLALMIILVTFTVLSFVAVVVWFALEHQRKMAAIKQQAGPEANAEIAALRSEIKQLLSMRDEITQLKILLHHQIIAADSLPNSPYLEAVRPETGTSDAETVKVST